MKAFRFVRISDEAFRLIVDSLIYILVILLAFAAHAWLGADITAVVAGAALWGAIRARSSNRTH